jgi:outer membrane biosynthesis protein TonB
VEDKEKENSEEHDTDTSESEEGTFGTWVQENMRMLISIVIVVAIAAGIYAYSKRSQVPMQTAEDQAVEQGEGQISILGENETSDDQNAAPEEGMVAGDANEQAATEAITPPAVQPEQAPAEQANVAPQTAPAQEQPAVQPAPEEQKQPAEQQAKPATPATTSQETGEAFIETAGAGDSTTVLARRALTNYLEKNPDSSINNEHRVYIEDYLRRQVPNHLIFVGETRTFQKGQIVDAIQKAKGLNEAQMKNLQKYAARVKSF